MTSSVATYVQLVASHLGMFSADQEEYVLNLWKAIYRTSNQRSFLVPLIGGR